MSGESQHNRYETLEQLLWPFVLLVGPKITRIEIGKKAQFWRDNWTMSALVVLPATLLEWLSPSLPLWTYFALVSAGGIAYFTFISKWRKYLRSLN